MNLYEAAINWLEQHTLPCPFKLITGCDCLGCGLQRSILQFFRGEVQESIHTHPAGIPMLLLVIFIFLQWKMEWSFSSRVVNITMMTIILLSFLQYALKWNAGAICN